MAGMLRPVSDFYTHGPDSEDPDGLLDMGGARGGKSAARDMLSRFSVF
jgi:hypothetical protein